MSPEDENTQRSPVNDIHRPHMPSFRPEMRPDHELPAPAPHVLISEHEPEMPFVSEPAASQPVVTTPPAADTTSDQPPVASPSSTPFKPNLEDIKDEEPKKPKGHKKLWLILIAAIILIIVALAAAAYAWYQSELTPVSSDTTKHVRVTITSGSTPATIAEQLQKAKVVKSQLAFTIYAKLTHSENKLKAGTYSLQPSLSTPAIIDHLIAGKQDTFTITFLPGDTLANDRQKIIAAGYSAATVDAALKETYNSPLFATKPAGTDLEGYIFGDTYEFDVSDSVEHILNRTFDEYEDVVTQNDIVAGLQKQGLTLYQGITLASIVQREVTNPTPSKVSDDQRQVARVFLNRLAAGDTLGSDVTYQYAAKKLGVTPSPTLDSLYNTRIHTGLPPGPIAVPGVGALIAVATPATNSYLFFLSGDDGVTYYATTDAQHEQNIQQHCQKKCSAEQ